MFRRQLIAIIAIAILTIVSTFSVLPYAHAFTCTAAKPCSLTGSFVGTVATPVPPTPTPTPTPTPIASLKLSPANGAQVSNTVLISCSYLKPPLQAWVNISVDDRQVVSSSTISGSYSWDTAGLSGPHKLACEGWHWTGTVNVPDLTTVAGVSVNNTPAPAPTIQGLTGSGIGIAGADNDPSHYGQYNAPGGAGAGLGLIGGPLLDNVTAAARVVRTQKSTIETGPNGPANATAANYFEAVAVPNSAAYMTQLRSFWSAYVNSGWYPEIQRVDGACPMIAPTNAEALQWAANKWGINPLEVYAEGSIDGDWDTTALGDDGTSSGICQVADRNTSLHPTHSWPGFAGDGAYLSRENACFNADFYAAHLYAAFHGLTGECPANNIGIAIQSWLVGNTGGTGTWTDQTFNAISNKSWQTRFFGGSTVPY